MIYVSTRGQTDGVAFQEALLGGLARDGGLHMPQAWPHFTEAQMASFRDASHAAVAFAVIRRFLDASWSDTEIASIIEGACAAFDDAAVTPLRSLGASEHLLELFHGPTLSFKDVAMQLLARLFAAALRRRGGGVAIIAATSGDTGAAAIHGFRGMEDIDVFILYPQGRISEVQRRQMTTPTEENVHAIAVEGDFDDCQSLVKQCFADESLRADLSLTGVNSINWARIMAQTVYYFTAALRLGAPNTPVRFSVPTGNFGNIFAGHAAARMGLPVACLNIATNANDILARCLHGGEYRPRQVIPTCAPSMDIQIASNFERLLFELSNRDSRVVLRLMAELKTQGGFRIPAPVLADMRRLFRAASVSEAQIRATMEAVQRQNGMEIDPHTAIGVHAARRLREESDSGDNMQDIILATAHPAKFPEARVSAPHDSAAERRIQALMKLPERLHALPARKDSLEDFLRSHSRSNGRPARSGR